MRRIGVLLAALALTFARALGEKLSDAWKVPVVIRPE